jgi:prepilin-type N-terminal cleavage/methylation domain-containing protein
MAINQHRKHFNQKAFSLVEVLVATVIILVIMVSTLRSLSYQQKDMQILYQRAEILDMTQDLKQLFSDSDFCAANFNIQSPPVLTSPKITPENLAEAFRDIDKINDVNNKVIIKTGERLGDSVGLKVTNISLNNWVQRNHTLVPGSDVVEIFAATLEIELSSQVTTLEPIKINNLIFSTNNLNQVISCSLNKSKYLTWSRYGSNMTATLGGITVNLGGISTFCTDPADPLTCISQNSTKIKMKGLGIDWASEYYEGTGVIVTPNGLSSNDGKFQKWLPK